MMGRQQQQQQSSTRVFNELCSLILSIIDPPPSSSSSSSSSSTLSSLLPVPDSTSLSKQVSPAGFACLLLGVSLTLMLCGSVTFVIGFILMPWVLGFLLLFYLLGVVSSLSGLGRAILCPNSSPKEMSAWNFS